MKKKLSEQEKRIRKPEKKHCSYCWQTSECADCQNYNKAIDDCFAWVRQMIEECTTTTKWQTPKDCASMGRDCFGECVYHSSYDPDACTKPEEHKTIDNKIEAIRTEMLKRLEDV